MESRPEPLIAALRHSHDRLAGLVAPLGADALRGPSYDAEWTIADVLSHLGSQAEIFSLFLDAGLGGSPAPGRDEFTVIWDRWNAKSPDAQAADAIAADAATLERFETLDEASRDSLRLEAFGMQLDVAGIARLRLGEHALHTWDIAVVLDERATVADDAVALLVDDMGRLASRTGKPDAGPMRVRIVTSSPEHAFTLDVGDTVALESGGDGDAPAELRLPAEALVRLVYGRLDPVHTDGVVTHDVELDDVRAVFPGF